MRLKLYRAPCVSEAIARIREELGADALILATRRVAGGVEVTAALDAGETPAPAERAEPEHDPAREQLLAWHGVPLPLIEALQGGELAAALARVLRFGGLELEAEQPRPVLFAGPPGAGKTLTVARLATRLVMAGSSPLVITTDGRRAGSTEQLAAFTRLLGLTLIVASHPVTLSRALQRRKPGAGVLIDASGTDPFDPAQQDEIAGLAATANAATALVLPAGIDSAEAADLAAAFAAGGASLLIATRLDMARRLGGLISAADGGKLILAEAGVGSGAADGLVALTPAMLAGRLEHHGPGRNGARPPDTVPPPRALAAAVHARSSTPPAVKPRRPVTELPL